MVQAGRLKACMLLPTTDPVNSHHLHGEFLTPTLHTLNPELHILQQALVSVGAAMLSCTTAPLTRQHKNLVADRLGMLRSAVVQPHEAGS